MYSIKSIFIAILLAICLQVISSQAHTPSGPWITSDVAGKHLNVGDKVCLTIRSPRSYNLTVNILRRGSDLNKTLTTTTLKRGNNVVCVKIPCGNFSTPSPQNYFAIYANGLRVDYSGTFKIGQPGFGVTIFKPKAGDVVQIGSVFRPKWRGRFVPPGQKASDFKLVHALLEPAVVPPPQPAPLFFFYPNVNFTFKDGTLSFKLPPFIPKNTLYKFGFRIDSTIPQYKMQIYSSGTFMMAKDK